jgi:hypothetical protein
VAVAVAAPPALAARVTREVVVEVAAVEREVVAAVAMVDAEVNPNRRKLKRTLMPRWTLTF